MALNLALIYPGQIDTTSDPAGYPQGKAKNIVNPGDGTGTPWEEQIANDNLGFLQNLLDRASIATPSGVPDKVGASEYTTGVEAVATDILAPVRALVRDDLAASRGVFASALQAQSGWSTRPDWVADSTGSPDATWDIMRGHFPQGTLSWGFTAGSNLPFKCTITEVRCWVKQDSAYAPGSRMKMRISTRDASTFNAVVVDTVEAATASTSVQSIVKSGLSIPLVATDTGVFPPFTPLDMTVALFAGNGATPNNDEAYMCEVRFTLEIL